MKVNRDLLPMKLHYFLRYAGTSALLTFLPLLVREKGMSAEVVGLLWMIMPAVGLVTNTICGTLADHLKAHRAVFLSSIIFLTVGSVSIVWIPSIQHSTIALHNFPPTSQEELNLTGPLNTSSSSIPGVDHTSIPDVDHTSIPGVNNAITTSDSAPATSWDGSASSVVIASQAISAANSSRHRHRQQKLTDPEMTVGEGQPAFLEAEMVPSPGDLPLSTLLKYPQFWLVFFALMIEQMGVSTCVMISDAVCFQMLGGARHKYGQQRLWGTVGTGVMGVVSGALVDAASGGEERKNYLPAAVLLLVCMGLDLLVVARMSIPHTHDEKLNIGDVGNAVRHPEVLLFLVTMCVIGSSLGIVWVFKLMMVEDVALDWDPNFPTLKLLLGIVIGLETFGGELPFFFLSGMILQKLGHRRVLGVSLFSLALRCTLYYAVSNPWYFLPIELLNGLSYSLFHAAMASYASLIAPPGAQATLQSIVRACFSAGLSTAGVLGGVMYHHLGGSMVFLVMGMFDFAYVIVYTILQLLIARFS